VLASFWGAGQRTSFTGEFSRVNGVTTANSYRGPSQFDVYLTSRLFLTVPYFEWYSDEFQNIGSRITAGLGLGYEVFENSWLFWEVGSGAGYQPTLYDSVLAGSNSGENDAFVSFSTSLDFDLPRGIEWDNLYKLNLVVTDLDKTNHHAESVLSFDIWGPLDCELPLIFDRIESPVLDSNGVRPESNDLRLLAGLGIDF
jgi:hypothetical protein